jgi:hypothetical protein
MRIPRIRRVADDAERGHTRVHLNALGRENVERPQRSMVDRPLRRTKLCHLADNVPQRTNAAAQVRLKRIGAELVQFSMNVAVRSDFVPGATHALDNLRVPLGNPADDEYRRADAATIEQVQQQPRREIDTRRQPIPVVRVE